jgi:hypothetical protein
MAKKSHSRLKPFLHLIINLYTTHHFLLILIGSNIYTLILQHLFIRLTK